MSDYEDVEDECDDDLPSVSLSRSTSEKSELEMPPASEVASLRAREEAAERALKDLREFYATPRVLSLSRSASQGSSSEEGEAALSAAVSALQVAEAHPGARGARAERLQLLLSMREHLPDDRQFLNAYIEVLKDKPEAVDGVTEKVLQGITSALISGWTGPVPGACAWLLCVSLTSTRALRPRRTLHALLDSSAAPHVNMLAKAACVALEGDAEQLLAAHDAVRSGEGRSADALADALLAHAMTDALHRDEQEMKPTAAPPPPLSAASISSIRSSWRRLSARAQLLLLRAAGRALAAHTPHTSDTLKTETLETFGTLKTENTLETLFGTSDTFDTLETRGTRETKDTFRTSGTLEKIDTFGTESHGTRPQEGRTEAEGSAGLVEGGAALLAALAQPLPRASAFHLDRQQVLTNVSKLQLLFRARFNPDSEIDIENLENSRSEFETPTKVEIPKLDTSKIEPPKVKLNMEIVTPVKKEMTQTKIDSFMKQSPMKQSPMKQSPIKQSPIKQEKMKEEDGELSPERKRARRERRGLRKHLKAREK